MIHAFIAGLAGPTLTDDERAFFAETRPWGFILFKRNIETPAQVRALTDLLREVAGRVDAPILIDQEGGRVQRMGPPHWPAYPPGRAYGRLPANDHLERRELARLGARLMAHDLAAVGINVDCVPVLDVPVPGAHGIIGDRAYAEDPDAVAVIGRAAAEGLLAGVSCRSSSTCPVTGGRGQTATRRYRWSIRRWTSWKRGIFRRSGCWPTCPSP